MEKTRLFEHVRMVVSGAEKPPEEIFSLIPVATPHAIYVEGYGITECAPVLTINMSGKRELGVGKPIPGVRLKIVNPDNLLKNAWGVKLG